MDTRKEPCPFCLYKYGYLNGVHKGIIITKHPNYSRLGKWGRSGLKGISLKQKY